MPYSHLKDMECNNLIKEEPSKNSILAKKEAASSYSEALTEMVSMYSSEYSIFVSPIEDLSQDTYKGNDKYPRTLTNTYDMLTHFELAAPRHNCIGRTRDEGIRDNHRGRGGRDHEFVQHIAS